MRRIRYLVASSLDGFIAGPQGEADWIIIDPEIDFGAIYAEFDTFLMGRRTWEVATGRLGSGAGMRGMKTLVVSRTLPPSDNPNVTILSDKVEETVQALRAEPGRDIWLFGGGVLFRSLLAAGLVDTVEVALMPVLLGGGVPLLPPPADRAKLKLTGHKVYAAGIVSLEYSIMPKTAEKSLRRGRRKRGQERSAA